MVIIITSSKKSVEEISGEYVRMTGDESDHWVQCGEDKYCITLRVAANSHAFEVLAEIGEELSDDIIGIVL